MIPARHLFVLACAILLPSLAAAQATSTSSGQAYPAKPLRMIIPFPPGGKAMTTRTGFEGYACPELVEVACAYTRDGKSKVTSEHQTDKPRSDVTCFLLLKPAQFPLP